MATKKQSPHPHWAIKYRKPGTELRKIGTNYYLYQVYSVYDKNAKKARKETGPLLGKITQEEGFIESKEQKQIKAAQQQLPEQLKVIEYGLSKYLIEHCSAFWQTLQQHYPEDWNLLAGMAYTRLMTQAPIKNMNELLHRSYWAHWSSLQGYSEKKISQKLRQWGRQESLMLKYMRSFIEEKDFILIDATDMLCKSQYISLAHKGYNSKLDFQPQFNLLYLFSQQSQMPVFYRIVGGNIREIKAFKNTLDESGIEKAVLVGDKGFYSKSNVEHLESYGLQYIVPLRRNNKHIEYMALEENTFKEANQYFKHEKRNIWYHQYEIDGRRLIIYLDEQLKVQEENNYLNRIETHPEDYTLEKFHEKRDRFGTLALYTNLKEPDAETVYQTYKSRNAIEVMFDGMKTVLSADSTFMQNEEALRGWMFVNHIALQCYQSIYLHLKKEKLLKKYSVKDVILHLNHIKRVRLNGNWKNSEVTTATQRLVDTLNVPIT